MLLILRGGMPRVRPRYACRNPAEAPASPRFLLSVRLAVKRPGRAPLFLTESAGEIRVEVALETVPWARHCAAVPYQTSIHNPEEPIMAIKPLEDRVVIKIEQAEQTTASGLVIPETAKEKPQEARVVAVGPGRVDEKGNRIPVDIKEGDVVVFSRYGGTEVKYQGEEYLILSARDVLAIVD